MDHPLTEAVKELSAVDLSFATTGLFGGSSVQENKIKVRTISEFQAAQLAIGDNGKPPFADDVAQSAIWGTMF